MPASFTLAHLTDAHLSTHGRFAPGEVRGKRGMSALNWLRARRREHRREVADVLRADVGAHAPDHVAMTGDITNFGLPREFAAGAAWLSGFGAPRDVSFTPGNHDAMVAGVEAKSVAAFAPFTSSDDGGSDDEGAEGWPWLRRRGPAALIGVTTAITTPAGFAQGEVGAAQRERLGALLTETRGAARIVLMHHTPTSLSPLRKALRDRAAVSGVLAEAGAELVLHGHNHLGQLSWIEGRAGQIPVRIPVLGAPSASTPFGRGRAPAEWRMISISELDDAFAFDVRRRVIARDGAFADQGSFRLTSGAPTPRPPRG